jgi:hypothetical protein
MILSTIAVLLLAGCISNPSLPLQPLQPFNQSLTGPVCHNVSHQVSYVEPVCNDVSVTTQVCGSRALSYDLVNVTPIHLCVSDGNCSGRALGECRECTMAMTRCGVIITNNDLKSSGTWVVDANFTVSGGGFNMNPVTKTIAPNQSSEFDFQQMYAPGSPPSSAVCNVALSSASTVNDCHDETRTTSECKDVTFYNTTVSQVCA